MKLIRLAWLITYTLAFWTWNLSLAAGVVLGVSWIFFVWRV